MYTYLPNWSANGLPSHTVLGVKAHARSLSGHLHMPAPPGGTSLLRSQLHVDPVESDAIQGTNTVDGKCTRDFSIVMIQSIKIETCVRKLHVEQKRSR